ncbi:hypothetical protein WJX81_004139 [Elliptochloris bilobata]|uniref:F-box domain-containing protein n=1 Tax=Elliptochloris bilobata TaxID=381761 RepID=A0AAW1QI45_9CHLO
MNSSDSDSGRTLEAPPRPPLQARKRRAVPPGALSSFARRARLASDAATSTAGPPAWLADLAGPGCAPFSCRTLAVLLDSRRRRVLTQTLQAQRAAARLRAASLPAGAAPGLLDLPEDVLLKVLCFLRHNEVAPLFRVSKQLQYTTRLAVVLFFAFKTPHRALGGGAAPPPPRAPRPKPAADKPGWEDAHAPAHPSGHGAVLSPELVLSLQRLPYAAPPRALHFSDASTVADEPSPVAVAHSTAKE